MNYAHDSRRAKDYRRLLPRRVWLEPREPHGMCLCWDFATDIDPSHEGQRSRVPSFWGKTVVRLPAWRQRKWTGLKVESASEGLLDEFIALGSAQAKYYVSFAQRYGVPADHPLETWVSIDDFRKMAWKVGAMVRIAEELHRDLGGEIADWALLFGTTASALHKARRMGRDWWDHLAEVASPRKPRKNPEEDWPEPGQLNVGRVIPNHAWDEALDRRFARGRTRVQALSGMVNRLILDYHSTLSLQWEARHPPTLTWGSVTPNVLSELTYQLAVRVLVTSSRRAPTVCALPECTRMVLPNPRGRPRKYCHDCKKKVDARRKSLARRRAKATR